jgi:DNA-directed RNA polymerase subunit RPC12/RpoP
MSAPWWWVYLTYPCPKCGAPVGEVCQTPRGAAAQMPHAARTRYADRCPKCWTTVDAGAGPLCNRCALVRALEVERSTTWKRQDPD